MTQDKENTQDRRGRKVVYQKLAAASLKSDALHSRKRTDGQRDLDLIFIAERYVRGLTQTEILRQLNAEREYQLSNKSIGYDLRKIREAWLQSALVNFNEAKSKELAKIDALEKSYWDAWEASRKKQEVSHAETVSDKTGKDQSQVYSRSKLKRVITDRDGDPVFLQGVERCVEMRCKILGLYAPEKHEINWRKEAVQAGVNPDELHNDLVKQFVEAASKGVSTNGDEQ